MRVLYVHGLESGPQGRKVVNLEQAGFDVVAYGMPCGRRAVRRDPTAWPLLALAAVGHPRRITQRIVGRSLQLQREALATERVDVVVGSSFGGAITTRLLLEGSWTGPTVLLCPAGGLVAERTRTASPSLAALPEDVAARVLVVHGRQDEVVPFAHSEALVAGSAARLRAVDDDHRLQTTATPRGLASWVNAVATDPPGR